MNLTGVFLCCQAAVQPMLEQGSGVIINLSSIYGLAAPDQRLYQRPDQPPQYKPVYYPVTKSGILGLTRYLAAYYAGKNIRVNALSPGGVYNQHDETFVQAYSAARRDGPHGGERRDERGAALPGLGGISLHDRREPGGGRRMDRVVSVSKVVFHFSGSMNQGGAMVEGL